MATSLSKLVDNLTEDIHGDKCVDCKSDLSYMKVMDETLIFRCFNCKKNYEKEINKELTERFASTCKFCNNDINKFVMLLRKGVCPYEYTDGLDNINETSIPNKESFYSNLTMENITETDYIHANNVFKTFKLNNLDDYNVNSQIKFKTAMLKSSLCDYSDAYILVKGTISVTNTAAAGAGANNINKKVIFKNRAPFTNCISEINNTQIDYAKDIDIVMPMYNLIEYSDNYAKTTGRLWQYSKDIPARNDNNEITVFPRNNLTDSFNFKIKFTGQTGNNGTKDVEIMVPLKYLSNFWRTLEMPLINCEVNLILT